MQLDVWAVCQRPKRLMRKSDPAGRILRTTRPDCDNVMKACADALQLAGVIVDDCHISSWHCTGYYAAKDEEPQVVILLRRMIDASI